MKVFFGSSTGRTDVTCDAPVAVTLDTAVEVFRNLDRRRGFMGIHLDQSSVIQFAPQRHGGVRVELLDTLRAAFDVCTADIAFAEGLIRAAAEGQDVFRIARSSEFDWEHIEMA